MVCGFLYLTGPREEPNSVINVGDFLNGYRAGYWNRRMSDSRTAQAYRGSVQEEVTRVMLSLVSLDSLNEMRRLAKLEPPNQAAIAELRRLEHLVNRDSIELAFQRRRRVP